MFTDCFSNYKLPITNYKLSVDLPALLAPFITGLTPAQLAQVSTYLDLLTRWNAKMNLTSIRDPQHIASRHFGESFFLASHLCGPKGFFQLRNYEITKLPNQESPQAPALKPPELLDLGSGAGFPAIPLKIYRPDVTITLIEANHRKAVFLREVLRALQLDAEVKNVRAEDLPPASADLVTFRAVERFESVLPTAARLVRSAEPDPQAGTETDRTAASGNAPATSLDLTTGHPEGERSESEGSMDFTSGVTVQPSAAHGLALLIGSAQISHAQTILPDWRFHPPIPIPKSQNRVIQLLEPS